MALQSGGGVKKSRALPLPFLLLSPSFHTHTHTQREIVCEIERGDRDDCVAERVDVCFVGWRNLRGQPPVGVYKRERRRRIRFVFVASLGGEYRTPNG